MTRARILVARYGSWWRLPNHIGAWIGGPPTELRGCWRTTPEGRQWQADLAAAAATVALPDHYLIRTDPRERPHG